MKKILIGMTLGLFILVGAIQGAVYNYMPSPADLYDLDHNYAYTWGVDWAHTDEVIHEAVLTFHNIHDYRDESGDILYTRLVDNGPSGLTEYFDNMDFGDYFDNQGIQIGTWTDPAGSFYGPGVDVSFTFSQLGLLDDLNNFAADGSFLLTFDPDCHYFNDGVSLTVVTDVPEPGTFILFGLGTLGLVAFRRRS